MKGLIIWGNGCTTEEISSVEEIKGEGTFGIADGRIVKNSGGDWLCIGWERDNLEELKIYLQKHPKGKRGYCLD